MIEKISERVFTVSEINTYVKHIVENDMFLNYFYIKGEIFNFKLHVSGHAYFTLKDEKTKIKAVLFQSNFAKLKFMPEEGMSVIAFATCTVYERDGVYQLKIADMTPDGAGALYVAYEQLKERLEKKGYFDPEKKQPLPTFPRRIGVVTSASGAAVHDIITIVSRRYPLVDIDVFPVQVQGTRAAATIVEGLDYFNREQSVDLIITGRGGGSIEELWAFNEACVADAIFRSKLPVISAVGHETDFTIADFVADLRASTPSAAAELCVPDKYALLRTLEEQKQRMQNIILQQLLDYEERLLRVDRVLSEHERTRFLERQTELLGNYQLAMDRAIQRRMEQQEETWLGISRQLEMLSPVASLLRGYAYARTPENGHVINSIHQTEEGDTLEVCFYDGIMDVEVKKKEVY